MKDKMSYSYEPSSLTRSPARKTAHDMTMVRPAKSKGGLGKYGGLSKKVSGGGMKG